TVSWVNIGKITHTVTAKNGSFDHSPKPGERVNLLLTKAGTITYVCTPHREMFGMLMVGPALSASDSAPKTLGAVSPVLMGLGVLALLVLGVFTSAHLRRRRQRT